jgi:hypothetical protein
VYKQFLHANNYKRGVGAKLKLESSGYNVIRIYTGRIYEQKWITELFNYLFGVQLHCIE